MVFDNIKNCHIYYPMHKNFEKAFDFIKKAIAEDLPNGRHEINGTDLFANIMEYTIAPEKAGIYEGHENYIDIQFIVSGAERIDVTEIAKTTVTTPYNPEKDIAFYDGGDGLVRGVLENGDFSILFPNDIHRPGMPVKDTPTHVKKIVVKVRV